MRFDQGNEVRMDVSVESHLDGTNLHLTTKVAREVNKRILILEEEAIKEALISLGWTPPRGEI